MNLRNVVSAVALCMVAATPALAQETGDLKIRFEYGGDPVSPDPINVNKDTQFCGQHGLVSEKLLVNSDNKGIKNVIVYVYTGRGGSDLPEASPKNETHELANSQCRFAPHIVIAQTGDTLKVTNPDPVGHNANLNFFRNNAQNFTIPAGGSKSVKLEEPEPAPIPVDCNIHPWMRAYIVVLEHPFAAKSDENGELVIKGLPAGEELTFRVYHEAGRIDDVTVAGEQQSWRRSRFDVKIEPGVNDMGTVVIPADALEAD